MTGLRSLQSHPRDMGTALSTLSRESPCRRKKPNDDATLKPPLDNRERKRRDDRGPRLSNGPCKQLRRRPRRMSRLHIPEPSLPCGIPQMPQALVRLQPSRLWTRQARQVVSVAIASTADTVVPEPTRTCLPFPRTIARCPLQRARRLTGGCHKTQTTPSDNYLVSFRVWSRRLISHGRSSLHLFFFFVFCIQREYSPSCCSIDHLFPFSYRAWAYTRHLPFFRLAPLSCLPKRFRERLPMFTSDACIFPWLLSTLISVSLFITTCCLPDNHCSVLGG